MFVKPACNCTDPSALLGNLQDDKVCTSIASLSCISQLRNSGDRLASSIYCNNYCPDECDKITYTTSVSIADYPTKFGIIFFISLVLFSNLLFESKLLLQFASKTIWGG